MPLTGSVTATQPRTTQKVLIDADPDYLADALRKASFGVSQQVYKLTFSGLTSAAAHNITDAAHFANANGGAGSQSPAFPADSLSALPSIGQVLTLRVTAGAAAAGARVVTDAGGAASAGAAGSPGVALISDDGTTLTFEAGVTGFVLEYLPRMQNMQSLFNNS